MRVDRAGLRENLAADDVLAIDTAQESADVVAGDSRVEHLAEHLDTRDNRRLRLIFETDDLDRIVELQLTALDAARCDRAAARDREDVLNRHKEGLLRIARRRRNVLIDSIHEFEDLLLLLRIVLKSLERRTCNDRNIIAGELISREEVADFHLDKLKKLRIINLVNLVEEDDDRRNTDLASQENVLARLRHRAVGSADDEDRAVHLSSARDHVLDVVGVARAIDVRVMTLVRLVLDVRRVDRDAALPLLRSLVDVRVVFELRHALLGQNLRDCCRQRRLAVIDVADRTDVDMRLGSLKLLLCHIVFSSLVTRPCSWR